MILDLLVLSPVKFLLRSSPRLMPQTRLTSPRLTLDLLLHYLSGHLAKVIPPSSASAKVTTG